LLFADPPSNQKTAAWLDAFQREIADRQPTNHIRLGWDASEAAEWELDAFKDRGLAFEQLAVLVRDGSPAIPPHLNREIQIRALSSEEEWAAATQAQIEQRETIYNLEEYTPFKTAQMKRHRRQAEAEGGAWFGAFLDDRLVGDLGVFSDGTTARFQSVETHPDFRRRGICQTLVWHAGNYAVRVLGARTLVIAAEFGEDAIRVYRAVGFEERQRQFDLSWFQK